MKNGTKKLQELKKILLLRLMNNVMLLFFLNPQLSDLDVRISTQIGGSRLSWDPRSLQIIVVLPEELSAIRKQSLSLHNCNKAFALHS